MISRGDAVDEVRAFWRGGRGRDKSKVMRGLRGEGI